LNHQPTRCDNPVENPEEQEHWPLTRRAAGAGDAVGGGDGAAMDDEGEASDGEWAVGCVHVCVQAVARRACSWLCNFCVRPRQFLLAFSVHPIPRRGRHKKRNTNETETSRPPHRREHVEYWLLKDIDCNSHCIRTALLAALVSLSDPSSSSINLPLLPRATQSRASCGGVG